MASAIVLAQVVMPVRQAFADTTPGALAASNQPCSSDLRTVYSDTNYQPDAAYVTNTTASYSNKDFTDSTTGIAWRQHNTTLTITNTSPYVLTDLQAAVYADAGRYPRTNWNYHPLYWNNDVGAFISDTSEYDFVAAYVNPNEPNPGVTAIFKNPDGSPVNRIAVGAIPSFPVDQFISHPKYIGKLDTLSATESIPVYPAVKNTLAPGESTQVYVMNWVERNSGTIDAWWLNNVIGRAQCNPLVPKTPIQTVVCGANNDTIAPQSYDQTKVTMTDSGWVNGTRTISYSPLAPYKQFTDGTTVKTYTFTDDGVLCQIDIPDAPTVVEVCGPKNDVITLATIDPTQISLADSGWVNGTRTFTYTPVAANTVFADDSSTKTYEITDENLTCDGTIIGTVFNDNDISKTITNGDTPYANMTVTVTDQSGAVIATTTTDTNGDYTVEAPAGTYTVSITLPYGAVATMPTSATISVGRGEITTPVDFGIFAPGKGSLVTTPHSSVTLSSAILPTPAELPHTGMNQSGLISVLIAGVATYGAVYFAQGRRQTQ